ncbi:recombinase family protein [Ligilactobacillus salivarius]|uniref:recombinase family protein n=1 Tax=Ligilactobacillus salivarius TaxID=1624 RepID=UPI000E453064|nr:recombinase family protein [Ligilactobacillus salivarius]RGM23366.1 recombinase family protein [Ligilactobacillus salivarius]
MKIAIYTRVSTMEQAEEGYSISEQQDKLKKYCDIKDWKVARVYTDPGFSGSNVNRPSLQQLISDCKNHMFDAVLVYKLDRLSRSQKDTLYLIEDVFNKNGVDFISLSENFDTSTAFGKAMIGILSVFAQLEREQITERMTLGRVGRAKAGKAMSWSNCPFGYTIQKEIYEIDPFRAEIVKRIYRDYLAGISITAIKKNLNEEGHVGKDINWSYRTVRQILDNIVYAGYIKYKNEIYPGLHRPIVSLSDYKKVQAELEKRRITQAELHNPRPFRTKYMLSGLMRCGYCNSVLQIKTIIYRNGKRSHRYNCPSSKPHKNSPYKRHDFDCGFKFVKKNKIESLVIDEIKKLPLNMDKVINSQENKDVSKEIKAIKAELQQVERKQDKIVDLYLLDNINVDELNKKNDELSKQKENLQKRLNSLTDNKKKEKIEDFIKNAKEAKNIDKLDYEKQKVIVRNLVSGIKVFNDKVEINWNI